MSTIAIVLIVIGVLVVIGLMVAATGAEPSQRR